MVDDKKRKLEVEFIPSEDRAYDLVRDYDECVERFKMRIIGGLRIPVAEYDENGELIK